MFVTNISFRSVADKLKDIQFLEREIAKWKISPKRIMQIKGHLYYDNEHDILKRKRTMIGAEGKLEEVSNIPNNRIIDNQYAKLVNQKANYLLGQPIVIETKNNAYAKCLKKVFGKRFMRMMKNAGKAALNGGVAWLYPYYDDNGELCFRMFPSYEILPFWKDSEHTLIEGAVRLYLLLESNNGTQKITEKVEVFAPDGIYCYTLKNGRLEKDQPNGEIDCAYIMANGKPMNWSRVPLIAIKYNETEGSLLKKVKILQDALNIMLSDFANNMQEDARNTILVIKNYDGENLGDFRKNLATYGAVKVRYDETSKGGVETLEIKVNAENYKAIVDILKKAIIENGMGYDAKDDKLSGQPNQMNIQSMYSDIDLDANDMETELQAAFEDILWFVDNHLANTGQGDFENEEVNIIFNRDILINESEAIDNCAKSIGILSNETIIGQHPWVDDPQEEMKRLEKQQQEETSEYDPFKETKDDGDMIEE